MSSMNSTLIFHEEMVIDARGSCRKWKMFEQKRLLLLKWRTYFNCIFMSGFSILHEWVGRGEGESNWIWASYKTWAGGEMPILRLLKSHWFILQPHIFHAVDRNVDYATHFHGAQNTVTVSKNCRKCSFTARTEELDNTQTFFPGPLSTSLEVERTLEPRSQYPR